MVTDRKGMLHRIYLTALVISYALFPPRPGNAGYNRKAAAEPSSEDIAVSGDNVRFYLADLNRAINPQGELRLLFPGCLALAAPLLLFRLKREGFSNGRALMTAEGVFLSALR
jgi:hypothetical protein